MKRITFGLLISFLIFACKAAKDINELPNPTPSFEYDVNKNQILFFNLSIKKTEEMAQPQVEIVKTIVSAGKIKRDFTKKADHHPGQLLCSFLDADQMVLKQKAINHPLHKRYEYENEAGTLQSKVVDSEEGQFTLRTQLTEGMTYLKIDEIDSKGQLIALQTLKL